jgi:hypothetical protein
MQDEQHAVYVADGMQAFFALYHAIFTDDYVPVAEDSSRLVKADTVLHHIRGCLVWSVATLNLGLS